MFTRGGAFLKYLDTGEFADLEIESSTGEIFQVHRIILARSSEFFARLLLSDFRESQERVIKLNFSDPQNIFPMILRYMYGDTIDITAENVTALLAMADHYLIASLKKITTSFVQRNITKETALDMLQRAMMFGCGEQIVRVCIDVIAKYFSQLHGVDFSFLPLDVLLAILHHQYLAIEDEHSLYRTICNYIERTQQPLKQEDVEELFLCVRFVWMEYEQLQEVVANSRIPPRLLTEALMHRIRITERPNLAPGIVPPRLQKRPVYGMRFDYSCDFDQNGILYWLATKGKGWDTDWVNPHISGEVKVTASSIEKGNPVDLLGRVPKELWTKDVPSSWFSIDLGRNRRVIATHYSLRHGGRYKSDCLRNWDLQGSEDGEQW
eukprot:CAMPEP_0119121880 /NCGR_PEP_ID=MMETSP1310-20130426/2302_1 /TAXON_ID=464262 /ORGANISM="Genus nov. species nov., Strain RCC2339" /LENGTH=379 /DNA_ID=CAMNT_0007111461 /DNA_START=189 /DNA_END=1325 /DNA_ORIENTATION=+